MLFGPAYGRSVPVLQVLSWSAGLVILRGTYLQALNAGANSVRPARRRCGQCGKRVLNLLLIRILASRWASATVASELLWVATGSY